MGSSGQGLALPYSQNIRAAGGCSALLCRWDGMGVQCRKDMAGALLHAIGRGATPYSMQHAFMTKANGPHMACTTDSGMLNQIDD